MIGGNALRLGAVRGIAVGVHLSWLIAAVLVTWSLAQGWFPRAYPEWAPLTYYLCGAFAALLLFLSVLAHEFGHALTALRFGIPVRSIVLFIFGGVATLERDTDNPKAEFWVAVMGPVVSALLAVGFFVLGLLLGPIAEPIAATFTYLAIANLLLLLFNLVPGFPLDGGRILRAILWWLTGNQRRATTIASVVGQVVAFGMIFWGISRLLSGDLFGGIWTAFIGWFLFNAAAEARRGAAQQDTLAGLTVGQIATDTPPIVAPETPLRVLARDRIMASGQRAYLVQVDGHLLGLVTVSDLMRHDQADWDTLTVHDAMTGAAQLRTVTPQTPLGEALQIFARDDFHQLPVIDGDRPVGLLSRSALIRFLQLRQQLGATPPDRPAPPTDPAAHPIAPTHRP